MTMCRDVNAICKSADDRNVIRRKCFNDFFRYTLAIVRWLPGSNNRDASFRIEVYIPFRVEEKRCVRNMLQTGRIVLIMIKGIRDLFLFQKLKLFFSFSEDIVCI